MIRINNHNIKSIANNFYKNAKMHINLKIGGSKENLFVKENLKKIMLCEPKDFNKLIKDVKLKRLNNKKLKLMIVGDKNNYFGYQKFSKKGIKQYNAYNLAKDLNINVCSYCNINYTHTLKGKTVKINGRNRVKSTRPEFDHFMSKSDHPILGMSFYNLIPSCHVCNSSIKSTAEFNLSEHLHPYVDDFNNIKQITVTGCPLSMIQKEEDFEIIFTDRTPSSQTSDSFVKKRNNKASKCVEDFALETLYQPHKDRILELVDFSRKYNKDSFNNLVNEFQKETEIFKTSNDVKRLLLCHHIEDKNINKRPFNKLAKDIAVQLDLL